jgi:hypothetical protein
MAKYWKFYKGDRVRFSPEGIAAGFRRLRPGGSAAAIGTVIRLSRDGRCAYIHWDGSSYGPRSADQLALDFLEPVDAVEPEVAIEPAERDGG